MFTTGFIIIGCASVVPSVCLCVCSFVSFTNGVHFVLLYYSWCWYFFSALYFGMIRESATTKYSSNGASYGGYIQVPGDDRAQSHIAYRNTHTHKDPIQNFDAFCAQTTGVLFDYPTLN